MKDTEYTIGISKLYEKSNVPTGIPGEKILGLTTLEAGGVSQYVHLSNDDSFTVGMFVPNGVTREVTVRVTYLNC